MNTTNAEELRVEDLLSFGRRILGEQPFSQLPGAQLLELGDGKAVMSMLNWDDHRQQHGFAHGGAIAYVPSRQCSDVCRGSVLGDSVTIEMKINYVRPAIGETLIATAVSKLPGRAMRFVPAASWQPTVTKKKRSQLRRGRSRAPNQEAVAMAFEFSRVHADDCKDCDIPDKGFIEKITSNVRIEGDFDDARRKRLSQIAERCPVHKTLAHGVAFEDNETFGPGVES